MSDTENLRLENERRMATIEAEVRIMREGMEGLRKELKELNAVVTSIAPWVKAAAVVIAAAAIVVVGVVVPGWLGK